MGQSAERQARSVARLGTALAGGLVKGEPRRPSTKSELSIEKRWPPNLTRGNAYTKAENVYRGALTCSSLLCYKGD